MKHLIGLTLFIAGISIILLVFFMLVQDVQSRGKILIGLLVFAILTLFWGLTVLRRLND
jgi:hypothetical protein